MFYIESPANVGYSVCEDLAECQWTDQNSADDNLQAVVALLKDKFTAIQNNDLYIAGESYAGIYVPQLVLRLDGYINATKPGDWSPKLKGFMVGNGVTNWKYDCTPAYFHMSYYHGMISDDLYNNVKNNCNLTYYDSPNPPTQSAQCQTWMEKFNNLTSLVNVYDIFGKCYQNPGMKRKIHGMTALKEVSDAPSEEAKLAGLTADRYTPFARSANRPNLKVIPPCIYATPILDYFHNQTVMDALHVSPKAAAWDLCTTLFNYTGSENATQWIYPLLKGRYRMLKYSGDADGAVGTFGTQGWINELNWEVTEQWRPYYITNMYGQQVAGYVEVRDGGFTFATVHGAGHMAPQFKRQPTYHAIFNWINGQAL